MVYGSGLVGPLPPDTVISNYSEIGSHQEFVQPVTKTQLNDMLMTITNTEGMPPLFPELPSPFQLFRVPTGLGLQKAAEFLYHRRGAQNWAHLLACWKLFYRHPNSTRTWR